MLLSVNEIRAVNTMHYQRPSKQMTVSQLVSHVHIPRRKHSILIPIITKWPIPGFCTCRKKTRLQRWWKWLPILSLSISITLFFHQTCIWLRLLVKYTPICHRSFIDINNCITLKMSLAVCPEWARTNLVLVRCRLNFEKSTDYLTGVPKVSVYLLCICSLLLGPLLSTWINLNPNMDKYLQSYKVWDGITCPLPNFNGAAVEVWEWISNSITHIKRRAISYLSWDLS